jgi:hypothetical protein
MKLRIAALVAIEVAACSSANPPTPCAPTQGFTGGGTVHVENGGDYAVSTGQAEDFLNGGSLTITAGENDAGAGALGAGDPVLAMQMTPTPDEPGTYQLAALKAQVAYCAADAKLVADAKGKLAGCSKGGATTPFLTFAPQGTVEVKSGTAKQLDSTGTIEMHIGFGQAAQTCQ